MPTANVLAKLPRFASTTSDTVSVSLRTKARMKEGDREAIYYITADTLAGLPRTARSREVFKKKGIEVL